MLEAFLRFEDNRAVDLEIPQSDGSVFLPCGHQAAIGEEAHAAQLALVELQGGHHLHIFRVPQLDRVVNRAGDELGLVLDGLVRFLAESSGIQSNDIQN